MNVHISQPYLQVDGKPEPFVEWLYNGERVTMTDRVSATFVSGRAKLRLSDTLDTDGGEYCCRASNSAGSEACKATLTVR
jgi:hypothetical protein